ncbi:MAG: FAD-dependent oxidoreductase [Actinomycetota bacterium]|nr:FAD-dependent oxidoreductase [Actinomycetota bacterium]
MNGPIEERAQVLVVGAGPAGLATALELAARGLAPLILECRPACGSHPRATALTAETMQLLSRWGAAMKRTGTVRACPAETSGHAAGRAMIEPQFFPGGVPGSGWCACPTRA